MRGGDKLLEQVRDEPLLRRQVRIAAETGCPVLVALPRDRPDRHQAINGMPATIVLVPDAALGMSSSLRQGLAAVRALDPVPAGLMVLPADMPEFTSPALQLVIDCFRRDPTRIVRGTAADGRPGHPAIFPADLWDALDRITGDQGGREVLIDHPDRIRPVPLPGKMAITDLDTPEDWALWRAALSGRP